MISETIQSHIKSALKNLGIEAETVVLEHPSDQKNGDYSTNIAFYYLRDVSKTANWIDDDIPKNPLEFAKKIVVEMLKDKPAEIEKIETAGAGFINFYLSRQFFSDATKDILKQKKEWGKINARSGMKVMVEYTQPNPFKSFHIGHLMSNAIGESISRIVEFSGAKTIRANYQGDIGPHVAKAIYGLLEHPVSFSGLSVTAQAKLISGAYEFGSMMYESDTTAKEKIDAINKKVYDKSDPEINKMYEWGRKVTLDAFEEIYKTLGTKFDYYFFESETAPIGEKIVHENLGKVFEKSDGAIVFKAEAYDPKLHTRVFINSHGLPTYETKELGLTKIKFEKENPDLSITTTAVEQADYMRVVTKAIEIIFPDIAPRLCHIAHGMMRLASGKMSSRKGNVVTGESLIADSMAVIHEKIADRDFSADQKGKIATQVGVAALKYSILHQAIGGDIIYDFEKSISFEGDSGPYLQYSATRAASVLKKAEREGICPSYKDTMTEITVLEKLLYRFPEIVVRANEHLEPHHLATYLIELAGSFNAFYGTYEIANKNDPYSFYKVALTEAFVATMKNGLWLLGIETPEQM